MFEAYDRDGPIRRCSSMATVLSPRAGDGTSSRSWAASFCRPDRGVLEGITRRTVLELSERLNIKGRLAPISADAFRGTDEVFLTSTAGGVMPVSTIDGQEIGERPAGTGDGAESRICTGNYTRTPPIADAA